MAVCCHSTILCKNIFNVFCSESGELINFHKSSIIFSKRVAVNRRNSLAGIFNMHPNISLGKYLDIHFGSFKPSKNDFAEIISKTDQRVFLSGGLDFCQKQDDLH